MSVNLMKILSGGQTGVDRGAIGAALHAGFPYGGWAPAGRKAEDGVIPACFSAMQESDGGYARRTVQNIQEADGTLVLNVGSLLPGGTKMTVEKAEKEGTLLLVLDVGVAYRAARLADHTGTESDRRTSLHSLDILADQIRMWLQLKWLGLHPVRTLNVAGPRESKAPGVENLTYILMTNIIKNGAP